MSLAKGAKSLGDELFDIVNQPKSKDFDPEADPYASDSSSAPEDEPSNGLDGREHYEEVEKSNLRKGDPVGLGPRYAGSKVARKGLDVDEDEDDHNPFQGYGSDEESDLGGSIRSATSESPDDKENLSNMGTEGVGSDSEEDQDAHEGTSESDSSVGRFNGDASGNRPTTKSQTSTNDRSQLKQLLRNQSATTTSQLAASQRADAAKGAAVRSQQKTFDALLNSRIRLQKGLVALNTLPTVAAPSSSDEIAELDEAADAADQAARNLWGQLDALRSALSSTQTGAKRKRCDASASLQTMWTHMSDLDSSAQKYRRSTMAKWSNKTQPASATVAKTSANRLNLNGTGPSTLLDVLDAQLADSDRLVKRMRVPRSGAPVQAEAAKGARGKMDTGDEDEARHVDDNIFDDADFYSLQLKELLEQRQQNAPSGTTTNGLSNGVAELDLDNEYRSAAHKTRKNVDTKASKGRKMRFTVHEKLLNFMVPDNRGSWSDRQATELFTSLFGADPGMNGAKEEDVAGRGEEEVLRLFRN